MTWYETDSAGADPAEAPAPDPRVAQLRDFALLHARAQGISRRECRRVWARATTESDWVASWSDRARALRRRGDPLGACRRFGMARFPYVDGPQRAHALAECVSSFDDWRTRQGIERLEITHAGRSFACWTGGLSGRRPLVVVLGGIVSIKEQWGQFIPAARRLGYAVAAVEMPGVGENPLDYGPGSESVLTAVLDAAAERMSVRGAHVVGMSFGGHLALRCARFDDRVRGLVTVGAPVRAPFADPDHWRTLPEITTRTLGHLCGGGDLPARLAPMALDPDQLARTDLPVHYLESLRDEIIPRSDVDLVHRYAPRRRVVSSDDVHGSPNSVARTRTWMFGSLLALRGARGRAAILHTLSGLPVRRGTPHTRWNGGTGR
ncbi:alpha/beta fold hydrolase [Streptomonospora salina]|uniref:Pimeloyl-ACP methyl ester carboxylesterase n=1 Tax=Streptomonospora salina TaxID=104205 RepID=A0A841EDD4_9ACTN|nr:alpha/beta hydrolase family protein [Streptomonospora salina]MBB6001006.1 pimeloyl-ACP methyl ester carboxylesterase [Streptomonospora salina]